jgi:hypothetical protein
MNWTGNCRQHYALCWEIIHVLANIRVINLRKIRWAGHVARMGYKRDTCRVLVGRPAGKRLVIKPRHWWEYSIKMDLKEVGWRVVDWIVVAEGRDRWQALVNAIMNLRVLWYARNFLTGWGPVSFTIRTVLLEVSYSYICLKELRKSTNLFIASTEIVT